MKLWLTVCNHTKVEITIPVLLCCFSTIICLLTMARFNSIYGGGKENVYCLFVCVLNPQNLYAHLGTPCGHM